MGPTPQLRSPTTAAVRRAPVVSVCIANWNCRDLLRACLASLNQPQGVPFEIIVVDNASADAAAELVAAEFPDVRLVRNASNRGFSIANNQAAELACGRYLLFLNNDTVVPAHTLRRFVAYAEANPQVGMIGPHLRGGDGEHQISYRRRPTLGALLHRVSLLRWTGFFRGAYHAYRRGTYSPDGNRRVEALMGACVFMPRDVFESAGKWDEQFRFGGEDLELSARVNRTRPVVYLGGVEITHYGRVASRENAGFVGPNVAVGYVTYFRKAGASAFALATYKLLVTLDAPVQLVAKLAQAGMRSARGDAARAVKSYESACGLWGFLRRELPRFWRA